MYALVPPRRSRGRLLRSILVSAIAVAAVASGAYLAAPHLDLSSRSVDELVHGVRQWFAPPAADETTPPEEQLADLPVPAAPDVPSPAAQAFPPLEPLSPGPTPLILALQPDVPRAPAEPSAAWLALIHGRAEPQPWLDPRKIALEALVAPAAPPPVLPEPAAEVAVAQQPRTEPWIVPIALAERRPQPPLAADLPPTDQAARESGSIPAGSSSAPLVRADRTGAARSELPVPLEPLAKGSTSDGEAAKPDDLIAPIDVALVLPPRASPADAAAPPPRPAVVSLPPSAVQADLHPAEPTAAPAPAGWLTVDPLAGLTQRRMAHSEMPTGIVK